MFFPWLSLSQATTNRMPGTDYHLQFHNLLPLNYKMSIHLLMSRWTFLDSSSTRSKFKGCIAWNVHVEKLQPMEEKMKQTMF